MEIGPEAATWTKKWEVKKPKSGGQATIKWGSSNITTMKLDPKIDPPLQKVGGQLTHDPCFRRHWDGATSALAVYLSYLFQNGVYLFNAEFCIKKKNWGGAGGGRRNRNRPPILCRLVHLFSALLSERCWVCYGTYNLTQLGLLLPKDSAFAKIKKHKFLKLSPSTRPLKFFHQMGRLIFRMLGEGFLRFWSYLY
jgi:hypothetical protein